MIEINKNNTQKMLENIFIENTKVFDYTFFSGNIDDTLLLGFKLAKYLKIGQVIVLNGELGCGKTVLMTGIGKYYDILEQISSPTFTIVNEYKTSNDINIYHFDVYRIKSLEEFLDDIGEDYFSNGISVIEWGNIIKDILPRNTIYFDFEKDINDDNKRTIHIWRK